MKRVIFLLAIAMTIIVIISCVGIDTKWKRTTQINTIKAYEYFQKENPDSVYSEEADTKIEEIYFRKALENDTIEAYEKFISQYPNSKNTDKAKYRIENIKFKKAVRENDKDIYNDFLKKYPNSEHKDIILEKMERNAFKHAVRKNDINSYNTFLEKYPNSEHKDIILEKMERNTFKHAISENDMENYKEFLSKYPNSEYKDTIIKKMAMLKKYPPAVFTAKRVHKFTLNELRQKFNWNGNTQLEYRFKNGDVISQETMFRNAYLGNIYIKGKFEPLPNTNSIKIPKGTKIYYPKIKGQKILINN